MGGCSPSEDEGNGDAPGTQGSSHGPGTSPTDQCHPMTCRSILRSQALIGLLALAWGREGGSFSRRAAASVSHGASLPAPPPAEGKWGSRQTPFLPPPGLSRALHASCSGVRQANVLLGMFAWLCAPGSAAAGLMGPWMVVSGAGGVDEGVGEESIRQHPQISKHQPAQEGTSWSPPLYH